ncbi:hypothetical protein MBLNU459_g0596t1 [Dothideomycetes sp. NU459]
MNIHIRIRFRDGLKWIARIRRHNATSPPSDLRDYTIQSEIATLVILAKTTLPTPKMRGYALQGEDNPVGVGYILMGDMPGKPLEWSLASASQRRRVIDQLANFSIELHRFSFDKIGCLDQPEVCTDSSEDAETFYLTHADDKGSHILVDEEFSITAIIDWEWAYTTSATVAFNSPMMLLPVSDFFRGDTGIGEEEELFAQLLERKGASSLAEIVRRGRLQHQLAFCCNFDLAISWEDLLGSFQGIRNNLRIDNEYDWDEWRQTALRRYGEDERLQNILKTTENR